MEKFFTRFAAPEFGQSCSAVQFTQASAYPIAVALMGRGRGWSSEEDASNWSTQVLGLLLRSDHFHGREALLDTVRRRFEAEGAADQFEAAVGDGQLWLTLLVACDMVSGDSMQRLLTKAAIFKAFIERIDLVANTDTAALRQLFRRFYDSDALAAALGRVHELGNSLRRLEDQLRSRYEALKEGQRTVPLLFRCGDVVWSPKGGWGIAEEDQKATQVRVFVVQAGEIRLFSADGWLVNVSRLEENPAADEAMWHLARGLLKTIATEGSASA